MGRAKEAMMLHQENVMAAASYLRTLDVLDYCEAHGNFMDGGTGLGEVWPIAVAEWKKQEQGRVPWAADLEVREFTDLLKEAYDDNCAESCYSCDKVMAE